LDLKTKAVLTEKQLVLAKKPDGHSETIAVLAFALDESGISPINLGEKTGDRRNVPHPFLRVEIGERPVCPQFQYPTPSSNCFSFSRQA
jgi:hypothetical protein